ncbi:MAG: hypothetical protein EOO04_02470 [Chitinophagaceae bacterium]|nr:MAG: hypothetical protein EOO04_02470 [Chitinophagaceae bacterium]
MKRYSIYFLLSVFVLASCGDGTADQDRNTLESPSETHPPSEAIPDSATIKNDSLIVPDSAGHHR